MDRRIQEDGTVIIGGQVVPTGGAQPTTASVVSYSGNAGLQSTNVEGALDELDNEKAPLTHTHDDRYFTEAEVTNLLAGKSNTNHHHDNQYYTESEVDAKIAERAPLVHTHDDRYFTEVEVTNLLAGKSDTSHNHDTRYYTESEVDAKIVVLNNAIAGKSDVGHTHDDRYYTEGEVNSLLAGKSDKNTNILFQMYLPIPIR